MTDVDDYVVAVMIVASVVLLAILIIDNIGVLLR